MFENADKNIRDKELKNRIPSFLIPPFEFDDLIIKIKEALNVNIF